jgi:hypothetical protein
MRPSRVIEGSHVAEEGVGTYRDLPAPVVWDYLSREVSCQHSTPGVEFQIGKVEMVGNAGTSLGSPSTVTPMAPTSSLCHRRGSRLSMPYRSPLGCQGSCRYIRTWMRLQQPPKAFLVP